MRAPTHFVNLCNKTGIIFTILNLQLCPKGYIIQYTYRISITFKDFHKIEDRNLYVSIVY